MAKSPTTRTCVLLFLTLFLAGSYFHPLVDYDNTSSRFYLLSAIVDHGTFDIDAYQDLTIDKSYHDGHTYSNKAFGASFLAVPVYSLLRAIPATRGTEPLTPLQRQVVNMATSSACFAGLGVVLFLLGLQLGGDPRLALTVTLAFSFGTIAWVHATMFSGHIMAAAFCFTAFAVVYLLRREVVQPTGLPERSARIMALGAGLFAGIGGLCDYTALYIAVVLAVYAFASRLPLGQKCAFAAGGLVCASQLLLYNRLNFGSAFSLSYGHMTREEFAEGARQGVLGVGLPSPRVILELLVSPSRGLLFLMPVLLFAVAGAVAMWRRPALRAEWWTLLAVTTGTFLINAGFYGWHGGWAHGPRYLVPMLPFLALPMIFAPLRGWPFWAAFAASVLQVLPGVVAFPYTPQIIVNPLPDLVLPLMRYGYLADNGLSVLGASRAVGIVVGLAAIAGLAALTLRGAGRTNVSPPTPSRALAAVVVVSLLGIGVATATLGTQRHVRLKVLARMAYDADLRLPYKDAQEFMEKAP